MSGYTPLFRSLTTGSLYGCWPDIGVFPVLLALADKNGVVDIALPPLAGILGLPLEELAACMRRLCEPDPSSRSRAEDGRRLVLLDPEHRDWGWRIVNHSLYREKSRKSAYDAERTASGRDADRKRQERQQSRDVPTSPAKSRSQTHTHTKTQTEEQEGEARASARPARGCRLPDDWELTPERRKVPIAEGVDPERTFAKFMDYWRSASGPKARKLDWDAAWRNWCREEGDRYRAQKRPFGKAAGPSPEAAEQAALQQLVERRDSVAYLRGFRAPIAGETSDQYRAAQEAEFKRLERQHVESARPVANLGTQSVERTRPIASLVTQIAAAKKVSA